MTDTVEALPLTLERWKALVGRVQQLESELDDLSAALARLEQQVDDHEGDVKAHLEEPTRY